MDTTITMESVGKVADRKAEALITSSVNGSGALILVRSLFVAVVALKRQPLSENCKRMGQGLIFGQFFVLICRRERRITSRGGKAPRLAWSTV